MKTLGILGTGLLGTSIGLRAHRFGYHVIAFDISEDALDIAKRRQAIDEVVARNDVYAADFTVIAVPVEATIEELKRRAREKKKLNDTQSGRNGCVIDIASVKKPIVKAARGLQDFVPTHPFGGREKSGPAAADAQLFDARSWIYIPTNNPELNYKTEAFIREMGSTPHQVDAAQHDALVACTSHLPHLLAWLLARRYAREDVHLIESLSGPVACELQRIARSEHPMWREIFRANSANIINETRHFIEALSVAVDALERRKNII